VSLPISVEQWREEIDRRLEHVRPARYHEDDTAWMEPPIDWSERNMPPAMRAKVLGAEDGDR
jgi:hypothetical protein